MKIKQQIMFKIKHFFKERLKFEHIPNFKNITVKIWHFPNFGDFVRPLHVSAYHEQPISKENSTDMCRLEGRSLRLQLCLQADFQPLRQTSVFTPAACSSVWIGLCVSVNDNGVGLNTVVSPALSPMKDLNLLPAHASYGSLMSPGQAGGAQQVNGVESFHNVGGRTLICEEEVGVRSLIRPFQMWFDTRKQCERNAEAGGPTEKTELQTVRQTETCRDNHLCERVE